MEIVDRGLLDVLEGFFKFEVFFFFFQFLFYSTL